MPTFTELIREATLSALSPLLRSGVIPKKKSKPIEEADIAYHVAEAGSLNPNAVFKRKYGILSKTGKAKPEAKRVDSDWGFPLPSKDHPKAVRYAHAVLSRAHQAKAYDKADVDKQVRKANRILYGTPKPTSEQKAKYRKAKTKESTPAALREWIPTIPEGSWERISGAIQKAAQKSSQFGGPAVDDPKLDNADTVRSWDIYVYASWPAKNAVLIANDKLGKVWAARFEVGDSDDLVTFTQVKPVKIAMQAAEAMRDHRAARVKESGKGVSASERLREWMPISPKGSWEKNSQLILDAAKKDTQFGGNSSGCWSICLWASYPEKSTVVFANSDTGKLYAAKYEIDDDGGVTFPVVKAGEPAFSLAEALRRRGITRTRESVTTPAKGKVKEALTFSARVREADDVEVDDDGARAVCIMLEEGPGNPVDGHYYTSQCIEEAAESGIFEGAHNFADHPDDIQERTRPERSIRDLVGWWSDVHVGESESGAKQLIGTYNIETGNEFALNKMREAKRYQEKYPDEPDKQYVGFSIYAGGLSELRKINGKEYKAVFQITEAGSTDMVTRAGAKGRMVTLEEAQKMATTTSNRGKSKEAKKLDDALANILKEVRGIKPRALTEADIKEAVSKALDEADLDMDASHLDQVKDKAAKHVANAIIGKKGAKSSGVEEDDEEEAGERPLTDVGEGITGDEDIDDILDGENDDDENDGANGENEPDGDEEDDELNEDDMAAERGGKKKPKDVEETGTKESGKVIASLKNLLSEARKTLKETQTENKKLKAREALRTTQVLANRIMKEMSVPVGARAYISSELLECKDEKAMRARVTALTEGIRSYAGSGVTGMPSQSRESGNGGTRLISVSGIESD